MVEPMWPDPIMPIRDLVPCAHKSDGPSAALSNMTPPAPISARRLKSTVPPLRYSNISNLLAPHRPIIASLRLCGVGAASRLREKVALLPGAGQRIALHPEHAPPRLRYRR